MSLWMSKSIQSCISSGSEAHPTNKSCLKSRKRMKTYGDVAIHLRSVQQWTHDFATKRTELYALPRSGRQIDHENIDRTRKVLKSELYISHKTLSRKLNVHHDTVDRILTKELELCKVNFKWISHFLIEFHKQKCFRISMKLFRFLEKSSS
jgi:hypothetical protein